MKIIEICFSINGNCNLNCEYCLSGKKNNKKMSLKCFKIILENIKIFKNCFFIFYISGGGEPTLHPDIFKFIDLLYETFNNQIKKIIFISNGSAHFNLYKNFSIYDERFELKISVHTFKFIRTYISLIKKTNLNLEFYLMMNPINEQKLIYFEKKYNNYRPNLIFTFKLIYNDLFKKITFYNYSDVIKEMVMNKTNNKKSFCDLNSIFFRINYLGQFKICGFCSRITDFFAFIPKEYFLEQFKLKIKHKCSQHLVNLL